MSFFFSPLEGAVKPVISRTLEQQDDGRLFWQSADNKNTKALLYVLLRPLTPASVLFTTAVTYLFSQRIRENNFSCFLSQLEIKLHICTLHHCWIDAGKIINTRYQDNQLVAESVIWLEERILWKFYHSKGRYSHNSWDSLIVDYNSVFVFSCKKKSEIYFT